jgi:hypothetical protein
VSRLVRRRAPTPVSIVFMFFAAVSVTLGLLFHSPMFILAKGAVLSGLLGLAFALSALLGRPLIRTVALRLSAEHREARAHLAERWGHPKAHRVFKMLSLGWGLLLLMSAGQQFAVVFTMTPGAVIAMEGPIRTIITGLGVLASVLYVRRMQQDHPELHLLPALVRRTS